MIWYGVKSKGKVFPYSLPSVGPGADPGVQAVSPQVVKKVKFSHTRYRALGPELILVYRQSARRWREVIHAIYPAVVCRCFLPACVYLCSSHQMALPVNGSTHLIPAYYSFYRPRKDERLSWPSWLTYSGWLTHNSGHPSAAGRAQDRESSPAKDRRSTTV